jgi:DNA polymerase III epsilon subunit-like protein
VLFNIFDTETTGLPNHPEADIDGQPRIIEFAGIVTDGKTIIDTLEFKCNPGIALEAIITKITGLTDADLREQPDFGHFVPQLRGYFEQGQGRVAHNLSFDRDMLYYDCERRRLTLDDIGWWHDTRNEPAVMLCTVEQSLFEYGRRMKLQELIEIVKGEYVQRHRALDDVMQLFDVCKYLQLFEVFE